MGIYTTLARYGLVGTLALCATAASAQANYDIATYFGYEPFNYGRLNPDGSFSPFPVCSDGSYCGAAPYEFISRYNDSTLLIHPGDVDLDNTAFTFTSVGGGSYQFTGSVYTFDANSNGVGISFFDFASVTQTYLGATTPGQSFGFDITLTLNAGDSFALMFDSHGGNSFDATAFQGRILQISAPGQPLPGEVPEPASWTMMISGFGLVGGTMRRRRATVTLA